uniref:Uncharacterized protein n=1 Tax=Spongospora subterranea TaxID=70186 RepID=A0A0H5RT26_9EUKA|eukprot:CRZ11884.1 hypothetical protein [Spongospora subterranea]
METRSVLELKELGNKAFRQGDYSAAIEAYSKALESATDDENVLIRLSCLLNRCQCHLKRNDGALALADAESALALDSGSIKGRYRRALALDQMGRYEEAGHELNEVIRADPGHMALYSQTAGAIRQRIAALHSDANSVASRILGQRERDGSSDNIKVLFCSTTVYLFSPFRVCQKLLTIVSSNTNFRVGKSLTGRFRCRIWV